MLNSDLILQELNISSGQTVVDAGCGNGYMALLFSKQVEESGKVYALDINAHSIECLCDETAGKNITPMACDFAEPTSIPSASVDVVYMSTVIHSQSKNRLQGIVKEVQRLLLPGGLFAVVEIEKHETLFGPPLKQRYSPEELQAVIPFAPVKTVLVAEYFYMQVFQMRSC
jgi:ubiquinone/menaquinone biosynthesis C-methylase UbiE